MPISYQIDADNSIVRIQLTGPLDYAEVVSKVEELLGNPGLRPGLNILSDHSGLQEVASTQLVKSIVPLLQRLAKCFGPFKCALFVPRDASYGMARMAEVLAESTPVEVRAFRVIVEAESWLIQDSRAAQRADTDTAFGDKR